ncbi:hypothetical protein EYC84_008567 [Monilinia fructicola]|uniref:Uncharacterized protein n=1 Tax=Monilinia fructicola TaxID=38448 RepID=A0A5M9JK25_MONFR|nr:hypothetical protein EYC84_008567 [Monilinia fructicola]
MALLYLLNQSPFSIPSRLPQLSFNPSDPNLRSSLIPSLVPQFDEEDEKQLNLSDLQITTSNEFLNTQYPLTVPIAELLTFSQFQFPSLSHPPTTNHLLGAILHLVATTLHTFGQPLKEL